MKLIFATDDRHRRRVLLGLTSDECDQVEAYIGYIPPWVVVDGYPIGDGHVIMGELE